MNKILLITTGGTLACTKSPRGLIPTLNGEDILRFSHFPEAEIDVKDFRMIDSSIMTDEDRSELSEIIFDNRNDYDAFVITHGTDSMAYTAAYLDCALKNLGKSVILTGSQLPLVFDETDADDNLNLAIRSAMDGYYGTCIAFNHKLIPAKYATKIDTEGFDAFVATNGEELIHHLTVPTGEAELLYPDKNVGVIYITPNLDEERIESFMLHDAVLALVLGSGGMPKHQEKAFEFLKSKGVKVYMRSQCVFGKVQAIYEAHSGVSKFIPVEDASTDWTLYAIMFGVI